jgi:FtsP/CotA-like multicopper oxidase with cupredoxin domain
MSLARREILAGLAAEAALLPRWSPALAAARPPDLELRFRATPGEMAFDPAGRTKSQILRYQSELISGDPSALVQADDRALGPTLRLQRGQRIKVRFENQLEEESIIHWHGLEVAPRNDGHPAQAVAPGQVHSYDFEVVNRAGTYWYHAHPDGRTGAQVHAGLAGLLLVSDDEEKALALPDGPQDLALVIQDRLLDSRGRLVYAPDPMAGLLGDRVFINGRPAAPVVVPAGSARLRPLNGSNARIYKLAWSDGSPVTVIATDGGLLGAPVRLPYVMLAPGQRVELWVDFGNAPAGAEVSLVSRAFAGGGMGMGMMGRRMGPQRFPNGAELHVCRFLVRGRGPRRTLPRRLAEVRPLPAPARPGALHRISASMGMMQWLLNGRSFEMGAVADNERLGLGRTEEWELSNDGGMMPMPHPIHFHGPAFRIVDRAVAPGWEESVATVREGLVDEGWRDTVLLMPGERVRLRVRHDRYPGLFLYHCHNLEHEDAGMMRNFLVER